jgi:DNA-binding ferritin-like protein (Dps family)
MSADDADPREILRQMLDLMERSRLNVQDGDLGAVFGDAVSQFVQRLNLLYGRKSLRQRGNQRLCNCRIALEENHR